MTQVLIWLITGLAVGWVSRTVTRSRRDFGVLGDLVTGALGGVVGGWLFRSFGVTGVDGATGHVLVALAGAASLVVAVRLLSHVWRASATGGALAGGAAADLEGQIQRLGDLERRVLSSILDRRPTSLDPNQSFDAQQTFGERVADRVASFGGSWIFIGLFLTGMAAWMAVNQEASRPFDPFPYILLNLMLSCVAALQAPVIMMSQNRQATKDRADARTDYQVNLRAELEIMALHDKFDAARDHEWAALARLVAAQNDRLAQLEQMFVARPVTPAATNVAAGSLPPT